MANKIRTTDILELLDADSDHTKFFYLQVSTSGKDDERQKTIQMPPGQQTLDTYFVVSRSGKEQPNQQTLDDNAAADKDIADDTESEEEEDEQINATGSTSQPTLQPPTDDNHVAQNDPPLSASQVKKA